MFSGEITEQVVDLLVRRKAHLYHACQYTDLVSYVKLGGVPSRKCLEDSKVDCTSFDTDDSDQVSGVWDKVFLNMSDFGMTFAGKGIAVPNPYGPIVLKINPRSLLESTDFAICLRSAGASGFDRQNESLKTVKEVDRLFAYPADDEKSSWVRFSRDLATEFDLPEAHDPEISCSFTEGILPMRHVWYGTVDSYILRVRPLSSIIAAMDPPFKVYDRKYSDARGRILNELANMFISRAVTLREILSDENASGDLKEWATGILQLGLEYQFNRYRDYLRNGTLLPLTSE